MSTTVLILFIVTSFVAIATPGPTVLLAPPMGHGLASVLRFTECLARCSLISSSFPLYRSVWVQCLLPRKQHFKS